MTDNHHTRQSEREAEMPVALMLAELQKHLSYDPMTGVFTWKHTRSRLAHAGSVAGSIDSHGYIKIKFRKMFKAHRLAWLIYYGEHPDGQIDHINGIRNDNRIANLRVVDNKQNAENSTIRRDNTTGFRGVSLNKRTGRYEAHIGHNGRKINLGTFDDAATAGNVARLARSKLFTHNDRMGGSNER